MDILITGSKGVIGTRLANLLENKGHNVFGIDLHHSTGEIGWEQSMEFSNPTYARVDVADFRQLERVFTRYGPFDLVYHTAAEFGRWNGEDYYEQLWKTNAIGTKNILKLQEIHSFKLVHFSTSEVYGDFPGLMKESVTDEIEIKQLNDYALSKWVNEQQIRNSAQLYDTETVVVRLFNTYGPGEFYHPYRSVNCKFIHSALTGKRVTVFRGHSRTSTYLEDCCRTLATISERFFPGETFNIGSREYHSIEELAELIWSYVGADRSLFTFAESEPLTARSKAVDVSRAEDMLGHQNTVSLKEGVEKTVDWMRNLILVPKQYLP